VTFGHGETFTRLRGQETVDPYSGEASGRSWDEPDRLDIPGCAFNPGGSSEPVQDARSAVISQPEVYAPAGADVTAGDRLEVRGRVYDVDGEPAGWRSPFTGWEPGMVVALKAVAG